jgi:hypothetical protein
VISHYLRKEAMEYHAGASDFHRSWIEGLLLGCDHKDEKSEEMLKLFIKARRRVSTKAAYAQVMDAQAQQRMEE